MPEPHGGEEAASSGLRSRYATSAESPGLALWRATNRWQAAMRAALAPHGLTHVQYVLLASLVWLHGGEAEAQPTQAQLADFASIDVMMASQVLRALEAKGLLERRRHPSDGRARLLRPTHAGVTAAQQATHDVERADAEFFAPLGDAAAFTGELARLSARPA